MSDNAGDGVALVSTEHPIDVTDAMLIAGENTWRAAPRPSETVRDIVRDIYLAMARAEPVLPADFSEDALEEIEVSLPPSPLQVALEAALSGFDFGDRGCDSHASAAFEIIKLFHSHGWRRG